MPAPYNLNPRTRKPYPAARGHGAYAQHQAKPPTPKTRSDPNTGLPTLLSPQEIRAQANQATWKSIEAMLGQLPSLDATNAPFTAQRAAIAPLVEAHKNWLMNAANYHMGMVNGVAQLVQGDASAADAVQTGYNQGGGQFGTNVTPGGVAAPTLAYGGSFHDYIRSLEPFATAQGIGNQGKIDTANTLALSDRTEARRKITEQFGELLNKNTDSFGTLAFNNYKGELAALAAASTQAGKDALLAERIAHDKELERLAGRRIDATTSAAGTRASAAADKAAITATGKRQTALSSWLAQADKIYNTAGGVPASSTSGGTGQYKIKLTFNAPIGGLGQKLADPFVDYVYGNSIEEARKAATDYMRRIRAPIRGLPPGKRGAWSVGGAERIPGTGPSSSKTVVDKPSENTRRARAWAYLLAQNATLGVDAFPIEKLRSIWLTAHPKPR